MKLIKLSEFILQKDIVPNSTTTYKKVVDNFSVVYSDIMNYTKFLTTPVTLSLFIPCDVKQNPLNLKEAKETKKVGANKWVTDSISEKLRLARNRVYFFGNWELLSVQTDSKDIATIYQLKHKEVNIGFTFFVNDKGETDLVRFWDNESGDSWLIVTVEDLITSGYKEYFDFDESKILTNGIFNKNI